MKKNTRPAMMARPPNTPMTAPAIAPAEVFLDVAAEPESPPLVLPPLPLVPLSLPPLALGVGE